MIRKRGKSDTIRSKIKKKNLFGEENFWTFWVTVAQFSPFVRMIWCTADNASDLTTICYFSLIFWTFASNLIHFTPNITTMHRKHRKFFFFFENLGKITKKLQKPIKKHNWKWYRRICVIRRKLVLFRNKFSVWCSRKWIFSDMFIYGFGGIDVFIWISNIWEQGMGSGLWIFWFPRFFIFFFLFLAFFEEKQTFCKVS